MTNRNRKILSGWSFLFLPAFSRPPPFLHSGITPNFHKTEEVEIYRKQTDKEYFPSGAVQKWRHQSRVRWRGSAKRKKNIPRWQAGVREAVKNVLADFVRYGGTPPHNGRKSLILAPQEIPDISGYQLGFGRRCVKAYNTENPVTNQKIL